MPHEDGLAERHEDQFTRIWRHVNELNEKVVSMDGTVRRIKSDLYNGDDDPASGLVPEIRAWMHDERSRRWRRSDKIAAVGILVLLLAWPASQCWEFVHTVYQITQEWHEVHKAEIREKSVYDPPQKAYAFNHSKPQQAEIPSEFYARK